MGRTWRGIPADPADTRLRRRMAGLASHALWDSKDTVGGGFRQGFFRDGQLLYDYNRCGVPLIEVVSEPVFESGEEAVAFLRALRALLMGNALTRGRMEWGIPQRCEPFAAVSGCAVRGDHRD